MNNERLLILGVTGTLGQCLYRFFSESTNFSVFGTARSMKNQIRFSDSLDSSGVRFFDGNEEFGLRRIFCEVRPTVVINCIGLVKQRVDSVNSVMMISANSLLPHKLNQIAADFGARLIHFGTDCVFSGVKGNYLECNIPDATDLYGRSKLLGEVDYANAITLRTSLIGHELNSCRSLVDWFLSQKCSVKGYRRAIFSGLPTVEIARVIHEHVLPNPELRGVYHLSVDPISKFDLLSLVAKVYKKDIEIIPDDSVVIDRSLDSTRFREATGFKPKPWPQLIQEMHDFR